ncbi:MAG: AAA family ATPase, partial [Colwellia sp.]
MKIKRVEIQAFKSYTHKKDGTFDFTVNEGQPAEIVSILAPNGFGKTSFYDAIDFCMTNNITRFIRDSSLANVNNTDAKGLNQGGQKQHILRAMSAPEDVESIIKITTDTDNFERKVIRARTGSKDYAFDDKKTKPEERYFRSVMLSQEAIDGFLRELKPDVRYEKFMAQQLGGDDTLDKNRQHIQSILGRVNSRLEGTQRDVDEINNKNVLIELGGEPVVDSSCLTVINELTSELNRQGCEFSVFDDAFDEQLHSKLLLQIAQIEEKSHEKIEVVKA